MRALLCLLPLLTFAQDFSDLSVEKVASNHKFTDGPVWSPDGYLLFCDVPTNRVIKIDTTGQTVRRENSGGASGLDLDGQGRLYAAESRSRRITRTDKKGKVEVLAESWQDKKFNAPNDISVSRNGHVYFTDPAFGPADEARELPYSAYHLSPKGDVQLIAKWETRPNGIALSHDGKALYIANSDERNVRVYDVAKDGSVSNGRILISAIDGPPGGIKIDEKGNVYIAANGVAIYSSEGKLLHTIPMADKPSNIAFGDGDRQTLYITAKTSVYRVRLGAKGPVSH